MGEYFTTNDHEEVRHQLVMEQVQEVKAYRKWPKFFKADYETVRTGLKNLLSGLKGMRVSKFRESLKKSRV